jgi:hypothetical protein|tara:strand:+ start:304 stop:564 length:261 start_codon:yes stop_codon:yes gene_type:complete
MISKNFDTGTGQEINWFGAVTSPFRSRREAIDAMRTQEREGNTWDVFKVVRKNNGWVVIKGQENDVQAGLGEAAEFHSRGVHAFDG